MLSGVVSQLDETVRVVGAFGLETTTALGKTKRALGLFLQSAVRHATKYALYVPGALGAVVAKVSLKVPAEVWSVVFAHGVAKSTAGAVVEYSQEVLAQASPPFCVVVVVTLTVALIAAPGDTVTLAAPFTVAELMFLLSVNTTVRLR